MSAARRAHGIRTAKQIFAAALQAADPIHGIQRFVKTRVQDSNTPVLQIQDRHYDMRNFDQVLVLGAGKASARMLKGLLDIYPTTRSVDTADASSSLFPPISGTVITKYDHYENDTREEVSRAMHKQNRLLQTSEEGGLPAIEVVEAGHPIPDESGLRATKEILRLAEAASNKTLIITLISGGGSSLLVCPINGVSLQDLIQVNQVLMESGADIQEINSIRKCISRVKGGGLARAAEPAIMETLILSDIIGDPLEDIASGPSVVHSTSELGQTARAVLEKCRLDSKLPENVLQAINDVCDASSPSNSSNNVHNTLIGSNSQAMDAAANKAEELGYSVRALTSQLQGDAGDTANFLATIASEAAEGKGLLRECPGERNGVCILSGGETTVQLPMDHGLGGRNQHMALRMATELDKKLNRFQHPVIFLSGGTDGTDGPTDAAGAVVWDTLARAAKSHGISMREHLERCDSYNFFSRFDESSPQTIKSDRWISSLRSLIRTGPTGTNVMDAQIILVPTAPQLE
eukprot:gb/GECG01016770.1/.p1 GENE.gb/GECG01016770.1/~~gb/GECG01016770.1/.p1  ORF type:complete len:520 (+),score=48.02 gb/GECG01016770.1/:1-1560(+)